MAATITHHSANVATIRQLSRLTPVKSIAAIGLEWLLIAGGIALPLWTGQPWLYIISYIVIGTRMYALYSLLHDGIHYLLYPNKSVNDTLCRIMLAWPLFISLQAMRANHFAHHKYLMTERDPERDHLKYKEFTFPQNKVTLAWTFFKDLSGINFLLYKSGALIQFIRKLTARRSLHGSTWAGEKKAIWLCYILLIGVLLYFNVAHYFVIFWLIPYATVYQALNRWRLYTEHLNLPEDSTHQVRSLKLMPLQKFIVAPHNLGFHAEHHLFPSVPFYNLELLHRQLAGTPSFREYAVVGTNYLSALQQLTKS